MTTMQFRPGMQEQLIVFTDSPDAGDPGCFCSYCVEMIEEDDTPLRLFIPRSAQHPGGAEYRLHFSCASQVCEWKSAARFTEGRKVEGNNG